MPPADRKFLRQQNGFSYILLLLAIAVVSLFGSQTISLGSTIARRDNEQFLLYIGLEFETALRSYAAIQSSAEASTSQIYGLGPRELNHLLKDPRKAAVIRHIRQIYADPLTGKTEWGLIKDQSGFIIGIYSLADGRPIKKSDFEVSQAHFEGAESYSQWIFGLNYNLNNNRIQK